MSVHKNDDGWPYPDGDDQADPEADFDDDLLAVQTLPRRVFEVLDPVERAVVDARFGLEGTPVRSMRELHVELGLSRAELRDHMGSALEKLRVALA